VDFRFKSATRGGTTATYNDITEFADVWRLAKLDQGKHAFKFGGEMRERKLSRIRCRHLGPQACRAPWAAIFPLLRYRQTPISSA